MKVAALIALAAFVISAPAVLAQSGDTKGTDVKGMATSKTTQATVHKGVGVVKKVDPAKSTVTLDHEPVKSLNWSAMTMSYVVKDKKLFDNMPTGKKVEFEFIQQGKDYVVTAVK